MVLETKISNQVLISGEDLLLENASLRDRSFRTNSHEIIALITVAIAARDKLRHENLARDEQKIVHPWFKLNNLM